MNKLALVMSLLLAALITFLLGSNKQKENGLVDLIPEVEGSHDETMAGPRGEVIIIGKHGGRYFLHEGRKVYIGYKKRKQATT